MTTNKTNKSYHKNYRLNQLYFYLTEGCNLRCRHCWIQPKHQSGNSAYSSLPMDLFHSVVEQAKPLGLTAVKLTGGEPLLHPQIKDILALIRNQGLRLNIETNGVLCTPEIAKEIKSTCKKPFVSVSLDGADAETHEWIRGVAGCFESTLQGIRNLVEAGLKPQVIMSLVKRNRDQIEDLVLLAKSLGAGSVKFNIVSPIARGENMHETMDTLTIDEFVITGKEVEKDLAASAGIGLYYSHPPAFKPLGKIFKNNGFGCATCGIHSILGVLSDGAYALCGIGETVPDLVFGYANKDRLEDIWMNTGILNELRNGLPDRLHGVCGDCLMKGMCNGHCIAQNYYSSNNLWAPFWYCEEARKADLFPETRKRPVPG